MTAIGSTSNKLNLEQFEKDLKESDPTTRLEKCCSDIATILKQKSLSVEENNILERLFVKVMTDKALKSSPKLDKIRKIWDQDSYKDNFHKLIEAAQKDDKEKFKLHYTTFLLDPNASEEDKAILLDVIKEKNDLLKVKQLVEYINKYSWGDLKDKEAQEKMTELKGGRFFYFCVDRNCYTLLTTTGFISLHPKKFSKIFSIDQLNEFFGSNIQKDAVKPDKTAKKSESEVKASQETTIDTSALHIDETVLENASKQVKSWHKHLQSYGKYYPSRQENFQELVSKYCDVIKSNLSEDDKQLLENEYRKAIDEYLKLNPSEKELLDAYQALDKLPLAKEDEKAFVLLKQVRGNLVKLYLSLLKKEDEKAIEPLKKEGILYIYLDNVEKFLKDDRWKVADPEAEQQLIDAINSKKLHLPVDSLDKSEKLARNIEKIRILLNFKKLDAEQIKLLERFVYEVMIASPLISSNDPKAQKITKLWLQNFALNDVGQLKKFLFKALMEPQSHLVKELDEMMQTDEEFSYMKKNVQKFADWIKENRWNVHELEAFNILKDKPNVPLLHYSNSDEAYVINRIFKNKHETLKLDGINSWDEFLMFCKRNKIELQLPLASEAEGPNVKQVQPNVLKPPTTEITKKEEGEQKIKSENLDLDIIEKAINQLVSLRDEEVTLSDNEEDVPYNERIEWDIDK